MNLLRETFHFLYASRIKKQDPQPIFTALGMTTILVYLNLLVVTILTDPFTGYFGWIADHGYPSVAVIALSMFAIGTAQYFCWVYNGKLERERTYFDSRTPGRTFRVYSYVFLTFLALPVAGILMRHLTT